MRPTLFWIIVVVTTMFPVTMFPVVHHQRGFARLLFTTETLLFSSWFLFTTSVLSQAEEVIVCEQSNITITCAAEKGSILNITYANYGSLLLGVCEPPAGVDVQNSTNCTALNSTEIVKDNCQGNVSCELIATNAAFGGNPCTYVVKYLKVIYECVSTNGESYSFIDDTTAIAIVSTVGGTVIVGIIALAAYFLLCQGNTLAASGITAVSPRNMEPSVC